MFGILLSAFNTVLAWVFQSFLVKFIIFFALYFVTSEFFTLIGPLLPTSASISGRFSALNDSTQYFMSVFQLSTGIPIVISAYVTRFIIRRLPVIG